MKTINTSSWLPLASATVRLNDHIQDMNSKGWELMSSFIEAHGIEEKIFMFWKKMV